MIAMSPSHPILQLDHPPLFVALIVTGLFLTRHSHPTNPGNVFKHIINWVPLFAHLTLLLIYSATGGVIGWGLGVLVEIVAFQSSTSGKRTEGVALSESSISRVARRAITLPRASRRRRKSLRLLRRRFRIPLLRLTISVANLFLFNMPLVLLEIVVQVKQWTPFRYYACAAIVHPHGVEAATALIYLLAYQRVLNDVLMGFATDATGECGRVVGSRGGGSMEMVFRSDAGTSLPLLRRTTVLSELLPENRGTALFSTRLYVRERQTLKDVLESCMKLYSSKMGPITIVENHI